MRPMLWENESLTGQLVEVIVASPLRTWETAELGGLGGGQGVRKCNLFSFYKIRRNRLATF